MIAVPAVADALRTGANLAGDGIFRAVNPMTGRLAQKLAEDGFDGLDAIVEVEMLRLDVEHDGVLRMKIDQRAIAFIAFSHETYARSDAARRSLRHVIKKVAPLVGVTVRSTRTPR